MRRLTACLLLTAASLPGLRADLIGYYPFDQDFDDASGSSNHLTISSGTPNLTTAGGEVMAGGGALNLDQSGTGEHLSFSSPFSFSGTSGWSVTWWGKRSPNAGGPSGMVVGTITSSSNFIWTPDNASVVQGLRVRDSNGASTDLGGIADDRAYHHWAVVYQGSGTVEVWRDNQSLGSQSFSGNLSLTHVGAGTASQNNSFFGQIDELRLYDEAISATTIAELFNGMPDTEAPTLAGNDIVDDRGGQPVPNGVPVIYTVSFSEDLDDTTVDANDFGNTGTATVNFGAVTETSPGVFQVQVTPTSTGTLQLHVNQGTLISDVAGNALDTTIAIPDDTTITVEPADVTPPTLTGGDFADNQGGGPVTVGTLVTFTLTFSEDLDDSSVDADDFSNAGTASVTFGGVTQISPGVIRVEVNATSAGSLQLQVIAGTVITDASGNPLNTNTAITADEMILVEEAPSPAQIQRVKVVLLGGQSNADGRADPSGLPASPVNLQEPQDDVDLFESAGTGLISLRPDSQFGPEITMGRRLADSLGTEPGTRVAILKYAVGGTDLFSDWVPGGDETTSGDGPRYQSFQNVVSSGITALASTYPNATLEIIGMLWVQGERDAGSLEAANYQANLTQFINDIRLTYGSTLPFVVSRLSDQQTAVNATGLAQVRTAQTAVAAADPLTALLDTDGFGIKGDRLHFDALGQQQIGNGGAGWILDFQPFLAPLAIQPGTNGDFELTLPMAFPDFSYTLEQSPDLSPDSWETVETIIPTGSAATFSHTPAAGVTAEFFRIGRQKTP